MNHIRKNTQSLRPGTLRSGRRPVSRCPGHAVPLSRPTRSNEENIAYFHDNSDLAAIKTAVSAAMITGESVSLENLVRESAITRLLSLLGEISGDKILTVCRDYDAAFTVSIDGSNDRKRNRANSATLRTELALALQRGGTLIVRQALPVSTLRGSMDGGIRRVAWRNLYAFNLGNDRFEPVPADHLRYANSCDSDGTAAERRPNLLFREYRPSHFRKTGTGH